MPYSLLHGMISLLASTSSGPIGYGQRRRITCPSRPRAKSAKLTSHVRRCSLESVPVPTLRRRTICSLQLRQGSPLRAQRPATRAAPPSVRSIASLRLAAAFSNINTMLALEPAYLPLQPISGPSTPSSTSVYPLVDLAPERAQLDTAPLACSVAALRYAFRPFPVRSVSGGSSTAEPPAKRARRLHRQSDEIRSIRRADVDAVRDLQVSLSSTLSKRTLSPCSRRVVN